MHIWILRLKSNTEQAILQVGQNWVIHGSEHYVFSSFLQAILPGPIAVVVCARGTLESSHGRFQLVRRHTHTHTHSCTRASTQAQANRHIYTHTNTVVDRQFSCKLALQAEREGGRERERARESAERERERERKGASWRE